MPYENAMKRYVYEPQSPFCHFRIRNVPHVYQLPSSSMCVRICQKFIVLSCRCQTSESSYQNKLECLLPVFFACEFFVIQSNRLHVLWTQKASAPRPKWPSAISSRAPKQFACCVCVCCVFVSVLGPPSSRSHHTVGVCWSVALDSVCLWPAVYVPIRAIIL